MAGTVDRRFMAALQAAQDLVDQMVDGHTKWLVSAWLQVWADAERGINDILAGRHGVGGVGADSVRQRMILWQAAQDQAQAHLSALLRDVSVEAVRVAEELAEVAIKSRLEVVEAQLPPGTVATNLIVQPNPGAVAQIVERATQQITVRHYYLEAEAAQAMKRALLWGTVQGRNPREMAARMVREVQGVFNGGLTRAMVIARTEMIDAYRNAQHEFDLANRDVLEGWQWQAELSDRTCFPAGTKVSTDHGPVAIEQLRSGDRVLTHTGSYRMVSETMNRSYAGIMVTIDTPTGRVTSTGDHPILVEREGKLDWMEAREVRAGDSVFSDRQGVPNGSDHSIGKRAVELRVGDTNDRIATGLHEPVLAGISILGPTMPVGPVDLDDDRPVEQPEVDRVAPRTDKRFLVERDAKLGEAAPDVSLGFGFSGVAPVAPARTEASGAGRSGLDSVFLTALKAGIHVCRTSALLRAVGQLSTLAVEQLAACLARCERRFAAATLFAPLRLDTRVGAELSSAVDASRGASTGTVDVPACNRAERTGALCGHLEGLSASAGLSDPWLSVGTSSPVRVLPLVFGVASPRAVETVPLANLGRGAVESGVTDCAGSFHREIVSNVTHHYQLLDVYNIEVEEDHSYIANGFVVHNCRSCLAMHGTLHDIEEPGPLDHHQGRCARVPVTKTWAALGFAQPQETRVWIDGDEAERWLERQPVEVQQRILTRRGYQAWQEGRWPRAEWTERRENPEWRPAYHAAKPPAEPLAAPPALPAAAPALGR